MGTKVSPVEDLVGRTLQPHATRDLTLGMSDNHQATRTDLGREELGMVPKNNKEL